MTTVYRISLEKMKDCPGKYLIVQADPVAF